MQSEFYLAQIDAAHAGKTLQISLWDPGDTDPLTANLEILIPTSGGWTATPVTYSATLGHHELRPSRRGQRQAELRAPQPDDGLDLADQHLHGTVATRPASSTAAG